jgi:hypothetical protein
MRGRPHQGTVKSNERATDDLVLKVDIVPSLLANREQELGDVVGVEGRRLGRETRGKVLTVSCRYI